MTFDFQEEKLFEELERISPRKVLVQLPEGVKIRAREIQEKIEKMNIEVVFSGETSWGGCCVDIDEAKKLGAGCIVHFGHTEFMKHDFPVIYLEIIDRTNIENLLKKSLGLFEKIDKIGVGYSVQHKDSVESIERFYSQHKKKIVLGGVSAHTRYPGQIVGCSYNGLKQIEKKVDAFIIVGNRFHGIGASLALNKPVFLLDVYNEEVSDMTKTKERIIQKRFSNIEKMKKATNVGIILEKKNGQQFGNVSLLRESLKKAGKNVVVISMGEITPEKIMNFYNIDAFVELACPRIAVDDSENYAKPILTYKEALVALGKLSWEKLLEEGLI